MTLSHKRKKGEPVKKFQCLLVGILIMQMGCADFSSQSRTQSKESQVNSQLPPAFAKPNEGAFSEDKLLANLIKNIFIPSAQEFQVTSSQLTTTIKSYCQSLKDQNDLQYWTEEVERDFRRNLIAFHRVDAVPFGPYVENNRRLADTIYAWPLLNTCGLDQQTLNLASGKTIDVNQNLLNQRGLGAIEYLLFSEDHLSRCNLRAFPQFQDWNNKSLLERKRQHCDLALQVAQNVQQKVEELKNAWDPEKGTYVKRLLNGQIFRSQKEAINSLSNSFLNIDRLKDERLARPLGRYRTCLEDKCPQDVEHLYSGLSWLAVSSQLRTLQKVFLGGESPAEVAFGFDDMLVYYGHSNVADRIRLAFDQAVQSVQEIQQQKKTLKEQILEMDSESCKRSTRESREVEICSIHADVREVAHLFKTEALLALSLRAPSSAQGDND